MSGRPSPKPDLALIHGWGLGSSVWQSVRPALDERFALHVLDLPGYTPGASPVEAPSRALPYNGQSFIETAELLSATLPENSYLCGWSLGGMLALQIALLAPQRCQGLILIGCTPSFTQRRDWPSAQPPALLDTFCDAVNQNAASTLQRFVALLNQGDTQARSLARSMNKALAADPLPDTEVLLAGLGWLRDVDLRAALASLTVPALIIHGENDPLMPLAAARWLQATLPNAQLELFAGAAHAPFLNDPEHFAQVIGEYCHAFAPN